MRGPTNINDLAISRSLLFTIPLIMAGLTVVIHGKFSTYDVYRIENFPRIGVLSAKSGK